MKKLNKYIYIFLVLILMLFSVKPVYADNGVTAPKISSNVREKDIQALKYICDSTNAQIAAEGIDFEFLTYDVVYEISSSERDEGLVNVVIHIPEYNQLSDSEKQAVMKIALTTVDNSTLNMVLKNKVYNSIYRLDENTAKNVKSLNNNTSTEFDDAYKWFIPFTSPISTVLGLIVIFFVLVLGISLVVDSAYITIPFMHELLSPDGSNNPRFVHQNAVKAVMESESKAGQEYVNPLIIYFKLQAKAWIIISICILYLCSGQIFNLLSKFISYFYTVTGL